MKTPELTSATFDTVIQSTTQPVLVDFHAEWCGPCRMMGPIIDQISAARAETAVIAKLDIDSAPEIAQRYGITSIPTLIVFKNGLPVSTTRGVHSRSAIEALLDRAA
jgi:thioredoxin 1